MLKTAFRKSRAKTVERLNPLINKTYLKHLLGKADPKRRFLKNKK
jgi:hypothetical protein